MNDDFVYRVEKTDFGNDWKVIAVDGSQVYWTLFSGVSSEARAKEYCTWKNVHRGGSYMGLNAGKCAR